jgi:AcrR family transcriptional regulator
MPRVGQEYLDQRRRQILDAAHRCFAREGLHRTTMQDIVRESRLSPGAIYRYYASKDDIIAAIAATRHAAEKDVLARAANGPDSRAGLELLIEGFLGPLSRPQEQEWRRVTVQLWGEALRNPRVMDIAREGLEGPLSSLGALLRRAQREGRLARGVKPLAMARVAAAVFQGLVLQQAWDPTLNVEDCARAAQALLAGLSPSRGQGKRRPGVSGKTRSRSPRSRE